MDFDTLRIDFGRRFAHNFVMKILDACLLLLLVAATPLCFAESDSNPQTERMFLRIDEMPFDREDCERFILGRKGAQGRKKHVAWLKTWDGIPFVLSNRIRKHVRKQDFDADFAVATAPPGTPKRELERIFRVARAEVERRSEQFASYSAPANTKLSDLQNLALGIESPSETISEDLQTHLSFRDGNMILRTNDRGRVIGEIALQLETLEIGYLGTPEFWIYEEIKRGVDPDDLHVADFVAHHSVSILRPVDDKYPFAWVLSIHDDPETGELDELVLDLHWDYKVHPAVAEEAEVHVPPFLDADGKASKFRFMGLSLTTEIRL